MDYKRKDMNHRMVYKKRYDRDWEEKLGHKWIDEIIETLPLNELNVF